jgi:GTP cyclohydrolase I
MSAISPLVPVRREHVVDVERIERAVREILAAIGENPEREGLAETPRRVARAYKELCSGLHDDARNHLGRVFHEPTEDLVLVRDIEVASLCEHHLLPFTGSAQIAYLPDKGRVVGLSKLARTVETFARRPQVQERLTAQIADALMEHLAPRGVAVIIDAEHFCMKLRGVRQSRPSTTTVALRGELDTDPARRQEVLALLGRR